jgi:hypothetical protein
MRVSVSTRVAVIAFAAFLSIPAMAAEPSGGDLSGQKDEATWSGGPFFVSNPSTTLGLVKEESCDAGEPACDNFRLTVSANGIKQVLVAITPTAGYEHDDYDMHVYNDLGVRIASSTSATGNESVVIENDGTSSYYDVRIQPWLVSAGSSYVGVAQAVRGQPVDIVRECLELVPDTIGLPVVDSGQTIELSVMLLLDGTDAAVAKQVMERAAESYRPLNINLVLSRTKTVSYDTLVSGELIQAAKNTVGGKPPKNIDLVGVFTNKQMQAATGGAGTVVGQADCIGGIRWDDTSFFVVSDIRHIEDPQTGSTGTLNSMGLNPNVDATAEVMAHEIGHLMGAHHHYSNCVEGNLSSGGPNDLSPCTLMFPMVNFASLNFSAVEAPVVRGHAIEYAAP